MKTIVREIFSMLFAVVLVLSLSLVTAMPAAADPPQLAWSVQYMIDQSQTVGNFSQLNDPRNNRGLALSPDGRYLYVGYLNPNGPATWTPQPQHQKQVRKIDTENTDYTNATIAILQGDRGKAIATDDKGRVYLAEGSDTDTKDGAGVHIYDADLTIKLFTIGLGGAGGLAKPEGVAVTRESGTLALYVTDRTNKTLTRFVISEGSGGAITSVAKAGLGGTGSIVIAGASQLRGVEVDPSGRIWMADIKSDNPAVGDGTVFRVNSDGTGLTSANVSTPIDIAFDDTHAFVTQHKTLTITVLEQSDMSVVTVLTPPWVPLELDPNGQDPDGALSGIVVVPGKFFYVANEAGQTASEKSTYGRTDAQSGNIDGKYYTDMTHDDNDPILKAVILPSTITATAGSGGSISPSGSVSVDYGASQTFTITPGTGYHVADVEVDNVSQGALASYTFNNVTANHNIAASFVINTPTPTLTPTETPTMTPTQTPTMTPTQTPTCTPASGGKQGVLDDLIALRAIVTRKEDVHKLDEAIKHLTKSLTPSWWIDSSHLKAHEGKKVFDEEKAAVMQLRALINDRKSTVPGEIVQGFIDRIMAADRLLAVVAIAGSTKNTAKAIVELGKGDEEDAKGHYDHAIDHYKNAWDIAT